MTPEEKQQARDLDVAAVPGPWEWFGNTDTQTAYIGTPDRGRLYIMGFQRWGMKSAQPVFREPVKRETPLPETARVHSADGREFYHITTPLAKLPETLGPAFEKDYQRDFCGIKHPDAMFMVKARDLLPKAMAEIDRIRHAVFDRLATTREGFWSDQDSDFYYCPRNCMCDDHLWADEALGGHDDRPCEAECEYHKRLETRCADCAMGDCGACNVRAHECLCRCEDCDCGKTPLTPEQEAELAGVTEGPPS